MVKMTTPEADTPHSLETDGLYNYYCEDCDWRYPHVGRGEPDDVAWRKFRLAHDTPSLLVK
jgi:hypothetical protein